MPTRSQVMPAVTGTIRATITLSDAINPEILPPDVRAALTRSMQPPEGIEWRHDYVHDNQLGGPGSGYWKGRKPAEGTDESLFDDMLVVDDQIVPAMSREVDALFARDPEWDATQGATTIESGPLITEMTDWHAEAQLPAAAKDAMRYRWWSGLGPGRVYIPDEYADQLKNARTLADALAVIHVQAVDPREGGPIRNVHGRTLGYWYAYTKERDGETLDALDVHLPDRIFTLLRPPGGTYQLEQDPTPSPFGTQGRTHRAEYLMWHVERDGGSSITVSVRHAQDRLNVATTYMGRNDDQTGYRQFIVSNAEQPTDKKGNPTAFPMGPGVAVNVRGLRKSSKDRPPSTGNDLERHEPTWQVVEPLSPEEFHLPSIGHWKRTLLEKLDQLWTLSPETQVSGESKRQSRKPFDRRVAYAGQDLGTWLACALRAALMLAQQITGSSDFADVRFSPKLFLDVDAANLEELRVKLQMWESGALTLVGLLEATPGVTDAQKMAKELQAGQGGTGGASTSDKQAALERLAKGAGGDGSGGSA